MISYYVKSYELMVNITLLILCILLYLNYLGHAALTLLLY